MIRNSPTARLAALTAAMAIAVAGCSSSSGNGAKVSERQVYDQEGSYVTAALNAAGVNAKPTYETPDPIVEYCADSAGTIEQGCVTMTRSTTLHNLTTSQMAALTAAIVAYWKRSGYGQLGSAPNGISAGAVSPGNIYQLSVSAVGGGYQIAAAVASVTNDHTFPTTSP